MISKINSKGFTLVELLAVLVVLSAIMGLAISSFSSSMDKTKDKQDDNKTEMVKSFAEIYVTDYRSEIYDKIDERECFIAVVSLNSKGYLIDKIYEDVNTGYVIYDKFENTYDYVKDGSEVVGKLHSCVIGDIEEYVVTFDANGGNVSPSSKSVIYSEKYGSLPTPTREGYTFNGWYTAVSGGTKVTADTKVSIVADQTLYARWNINSYTITFNANGGSVSPSSKSVIYGGEYGELPNPTYTGYTFDGWYTQSIGGTKVESTTTVSITAAQTLYAHWTANNYIIAYTLNNGISGSSAPTTATYDTAVTISNPTKTVTVTGNANSTGATVGSDTSKAQTFAGWTSTNINTSTAYYGSNAWTNGSTKVTATSFKNLTPTNRATVTLVANWTPVAFNLPTVTKTGYLCTWNTASDGSGTSYDSGGSYTPSVTGSTSVTMYAVCIRNSYTVTYKVDSSISYTEDVNDGASALSPSTFTPSKSGWTFAGWREDSTASSSVLTSKKVDGANLTLYAVFKQDVTLTTVANGVSTPSKKQRYYNNGNTVNPTFTVSNPTKASATFKGWSISSSSTTVTNSSISNLSLSASTTRYAVFKYNDATLKTGASYYNLSAALWDRDYERYTVLSGIDGTKYESLACTVSVPKLEVAGWAIQCNAYAKLIIGSQSMNLRYVVSYEGNTDYARDAGNYICTNGATGTATFTLDNKSGLSLIASFETDAVAGQIMVSTVNVYGRTVVG